MGFITTVTTCLHPYVTPPIISGGMGYVYAGELINQSQIASAIIIFPYIDYLTKMYVSV